MGHAACMEGMRTTCKVFVGEPQEKKPLGKHRHRWEDNIKNES
jgi:hypothetical protein